MWHFKRGFQIQALIKCGATSNLAWLMAFLNENFPSFNFQDGRCVMKGKWPWVLLYSCINNEINGLVNANPFIVQLFFQSFLKECHIVYALLNLAIVKMSVLVDVWSLKLNINSLLTVCLHVHTCTQLQHLLTSLSVPIVRFLKCWWIGQKVRIQGHAGAALKTDSFSSQCCRCINQSLVQNNKQHAW